jgi:hypothetical protein
MIAWCGGGVPERTKGYFTSHLAAVSKVLHGYHVQITARSDADLAPEDIMQKVADASGAKYSAGTATPTPAAAPPPVAKKPVFTPTTSGSAGSFNPLAARTRGRGGADDDGWGADAPPVTRTQIEKVESAYKPTKVDIASLRKNNDDSRFNGSSQQDDRPGDVVRGGYQPVGKIDIAALRANAKQDDRPTVVKGAYEPVGKVDIAAIRARSQRPAEPAEEENPAPPKSLAERSAAFTPSERLTELPKPKVAKKFGATPFAGTKAPTPVGLGFGAPSTPAPPPVGAASRTFADQGGKTPAQLWAEKKAKQSGASPSAISPAPASPITAQQSGSEWRSGYAGKSWATVQTANYGRGGLEAQKTGGTDRSEPEAEQPAATGDGISALRDRFKDAAPMGTATRSNPGAAAQDEEEVAPPPPAAGSRPAGGFALPGLPSRPAAENQEEEEKEEAPPSVPSRNYEEREPSPVRVAMPVPRSSAPEIEPAAESLPPRPIPVPQEVPKEAELPAERETQNPRTAAIAAASVATAAAVGGAVAYAAGNESDAAAGPTGGRKALIQYDYEKAEDNELELREGEYVTNIEMVDDDWWMGTNSQGESGLFPSNYVELVDDDEDTAAPQPPAPAPAPQREEPPQPEPAAAGPTATAQFDYEAAEDNGMCALGSPCFMLLAGQMSLTSSTVELSFPEGATITDLDFPDEDWWFGHYGGASGLFPANYVQLDS